MYVNSKKFLIKKKKIVYNISILCIEYLNMIYFFRSKLRSSIFRICIKNGYNRYFIIFIQTKLMAFVIIK